jgi:hypothetical protein
MAWRKLPEQQRELLVQLQQRELLVQQELQQLGQLQEQPLLLFYRKLPRQQQR